MDSQRWLSELRREFVRRKLPPRYVERLISELSDHLTDFMEDHMSMDATDLRDAVRPMGLPSQIAAVAASEFRKQRFSGRHPVITFVVTPIALLPILKLAGVFFVILTVLPLAWLGLLTDEPGPLSRPVEIIVLVVAYSCMELPILVCVALLCRSAHKAAMNWRWSMLACSIFAILSVAISVGLAMPTAERQGYWYFGFGLSHRTLQLVIAQFVAPLVIGCWLVWRRASNRRYLCES